MTGALEDQYAINKQNKYIIDGKIDYITSYTFMKNTIN